MKMLIRIVLILLCWLTAISLLAIKSDREFIRYLPQEGETSSTVLNANTDYQQTFVATRRSISRLSLFIRPTANSPLPDQSLRLSLFSDNTTLTNIDVPVSFIDSTGATQVTLPQPLSTIPGQKITFSLTVPVALSGQLRAQQINLDDGLDVSSLSFSVNQAPQQHPLAFQIYYGFRPPFAYQLAILFLFLSLWLIFNRPFLHPLVLLAYVTTAMVAGLSPAAILGFYSWPLIVSFVVALGGMILLLRSYQLPALAVVIGANTFAFSTYFALHAQAGRAQLLVIAFLPLFIFLNRTKVTTAHRLIFLILAGISAFSFFLLSPYQPPAPPPTLIANLKDVLLDPNQVPTADKFQAAFYALQIPQGDPTSITQSGGWDNFGSYVGVINLVLALLGLVIYAKRFWFVTLIGLIGLIIAATPLTPRLISVLFVPPQYFIIFTTFALSFFAAFGLLKLRQFLGLNTLTQFILTAITLFALFDLLNVTSKTLQFGLL